MKNNYNNSVEDQVYHTLQELQQICYLVTLDGLIECFESDDSDYIYLAERLKEKYKKQTDV